MFYHLLKKNMALNGIVIFLLLFTIIYYSLGANHFHIKNNVSLGWVESFYFSTSMQTLLGIGDITPKTNLAKIIVSVQSLITITITLLYSGMVF